ncbi:MAG: hypothetical protein ACLUF5_03730 [Clostridia bacterium]|jgi:hypothetical protein
MARRIKIRRKKTIKTWYLLIMLIVVLIATSISYAIWNTQLHIYGTVTGEKTEPKLPVTITSLGEDSNGVTRYTDSSDSVFISATWKDVILKITSETYEDNMITTNLKHNKKQYIWKSDYTVNIKVPLPNQSGYDFTDGMIEKVTDQCSDANAVFKDPTWATTETIANGETGTMIITGIINGGSTIAANTYYTFKASYMVDGIRRYFYYKLVLIPYSF